MDRIPVIELDWFKGNEFLAIADVMYVEGVGICSHQPSLNIRPGVYEMLDMGGLIHCVSSDRLFTATQEEEQRYWRKLEEEG